MIRAIAYLLLFVAVASSFKTPSSSVRPPLSLRKRESFLSWNPNWSEETLEDESPSAESSEEREISSDDSSDAVSGEWKKDVQSDRRQARQSSYYTARRPVKPIPLSASEPEKRDWKTRFCSSQNDVEPPPEVQNLWPLDNAGVPDSLKGNSSK